MSTNKNNDLTPKVTGLGGVFFFSKNPEAMRNWYAEHLGMSVHPWGATFESRNIDQPEDVESTQWSPFKEGSEYFAPSSKEFMINFRVQNIEGLVEQLQAQGVQLVGELVVDDFGKFAHIMDNEGNKIELWEPAK